MREIQEKQKFYFTYCKFHKFYFQFSLLPQRSNTEVIIVKFTTFLNVCLYAWICRAFRKTFCDEKGVMHGLTKVANSASYPFPINSPFTQSHFSPTSHSLYTLTFHLFPHTFPAHISFLLFTLFTLPGYESKVKQLQRHPLQVTISIRI